MRMKFYISTRPQTNGSHTIHKDGCPLLPEPGERIFLGVFHLQRDATEEGRKYFSRIYSCPFCLKEVHAVRKIPVDHALNIEESFLSYRRLALTWESAMICGVN